MPKRKRKTPAPPPRAVPPPLPRVSPRALNLATLAVFAAVFAVYLLTLMPTVVDQDCGELVASAHVLGIPHPTGYPLWTLLARLFDLLPIGHTSAYRVALFSAFCAAAAAALLSRLVLLLSGGLLAALSAGLCFGFWLPTWSQATRPEVYPLEALLFSLFLVAVLKWDQDRTPRRLFWVALAAGTASMHHRTAFLAVAPALAVAFWFTRPRRVTLPAQAKTWAKAAAVAAAPFLLYLYLPIRAAARPPMNWGNPDTLERFLLHASGQQYAMYALRNSPEVALQQARKLLLESLAGPAWPSLVLGLLGAALIVWGLVWWRRRQPAVATALAAGAAIVWVWVIFWSDVSDSKVWLLPVGGVLAICGGLGLDRLRATLPNRLLGSAAVVAVAALFLGILIPANWAKCDQSNVWRERDASAAALAQTDKNPVFVVVSDDPLFAAYYLKNVDGFRRDVTVLRPYGFESDWYGELLNDKDLSDTGYALWRTLTQPFRPNPPGPRDLHEITAQFAYRMAQHYGTRRAVYAPYPPLTPLPAPPYFVGLRDDLVRLDFTPPDVLRTGDPGAPWTSLGNGLDLLSLAFDRSQVQTGELVPFRVRWRLGDPLPGAYFALRLVPAQPPANWDRLEKKGAFAQGYPLLYGLWGYPGKAASPPGTSYEQRAQFIVPSNAPGGEYRLEIGYSVGSFPAEYGGWTPLGERVKLHVHPRPLPTN